MKYKGLLYSCAVILSLWSSLVAANDTAVGQANGTILFLKEPNIRMDSEKLRISEELVDVQYVFTNPTSKDIFIPIAFPMPAKMFDGRDDSTVTNFQVFVNGVSQQFEQRTVILLDRKTDITQQMEALGWDMEDVESFLSKFYYEADSVATREDRSNLPNDWFDAKGRVRFSVHEYYLWNQNFPANSSINISHIYSPSVSGGVPRGWGEFTEFFNTVENYCMSETNDKTYLNGPLLWHELEYVLKTGANWNGPIRDFHLIIEKALPETKVHLCFDGKLEKTSDRTFEFRAKNYTPKQDLKLFFYTIDESEDE